MNKLTPEQVALAESNIHLLKKAESYWGYRLPYVSKDEIHDACVTALIKVAKSFDPSFGKSFKIMYIYSVSNEMQRAYRDRNVQKRSGVVVSLDKTVNVNDEYSFSIEDTLGQEDAYTFLDREFLSHTFSVLDDRERECIQLAYFRDMNQKEISKYIGCSQMHVSRITRRALRKMRERALRIG
jgi:RNA polymerase sigma factor (sigma-70 family)